MQELRQRERRRQRQKRLEAPKKTHRIFTRYAYHTHKWLETEEVGSFKQLWAKYKDKKDVAFFCADIPPHLEDGKWTTDAAYRLSEDNLKSYGSHKCWYDAEMSKALGIRVMLVFNAS